MDKSVDGWEEAITLKLSEIYFNYLLCKPSESRLIVLENPLSPTYFKRIVNEIAKSKLNVLYNNIFYV